MTHNAPKFDMSQVIAIDSQQVSDSTDKAFQDTFRTVVERIKRVRTVSQVRVATSHGKDSTVLLNAALQAHIELVAEGVIDNDAPFICTNIDTRVDDIYVRAQIKHEVAMLRDYCNKQGVNLRYLTAKPPARYSWAVMYASGAKLPSFVKSSADCSIILKIDPAKRLERELFAELGEDMITLLGSRSEESARRAASITKHSTSVDDVEIHGGTDGKPRSCAPMQDLTDGDVFGILRRMGEMPIVKTDYSIPSYAPHHKLIIKLYGDAQETCPVSSFADAAVPKAGSCGSSRFGCTLCLKVQEDKSATARSASAQYAAAANVLAIRDYLAHHAEDMSLREPLAKSVCPVTKAIVIQENTFNAPTLERLIYWLCQATRDDRLRAENFRELVATNRLHEDAGYSEIMSDSTLTDDDKRYFGEFYVQAHQEHMVNLIDIEQIMLICAIHARDGVKLPPFHALWIYNEVEQGRYIPYPTVEGVMKSDSVPNPRFIELALPKTVKLHLGEVLLDTELSCGDGDKTPAYEQVSLASLLSLASKNVSLKHPFTKRQIVQKRRKNGMATGIKRGRMSVQLPDVQRQPHLMRQHNQAITVPAPTSSANEHDAVKMLGIAASTDNTPGGMSIETGESLYWFLEMELSRILERHKQFVQANGTYAFGGIHPLQKMLSFGVLTLTAKAMRATDLMLMRTDMLHQAGLYDLSKAKLKQVSMSQRAYRSLKASKLLAVRRLRNQARANAKQKLGQLAAAPHDYIAHDVMQALEDVTPTAAQAVFDILAYTRILNGPGDFMFDGTSIQKRCDDAKTALKSLDRVFASVPGLLKTLGIDAEQAEKRTQKAASSVVARYQDMKRQAAKDALDAHQGVIQSPGEATRMSSMLLAHAQNTKPLTLAAAQATLGLTKTSEFKARFAQPSQRKLTRLTFALN